MAKEFVRVDELMPQITVEQALAYYGIAADLKRVGDEVRSRCFLRCGRTEETGDRALSIRADDPVKPWKCHQYGCGRSGNLVSLCDLLKPGANMDGRPRGERFKAIAQDLRAIVEGHCPAPLREGVSPAQPAPLPPRVNVPLARSPNERARALTLLDAKFVTDPEAMPPAASAYVRRRPFLTPEACRKWRIGYLPRDTGADRGGGTMRGAFVYPLLSEQGEVLTWFGRDPDFERKHALWNAGGKVGHEPEKFHFVKGFHRGLELFGQQASRLREPGYGERVAELGIIVVEGPNDVIGLDTLGVPAVALMGNSITDDQVTKLARWAHRLAGGVVTLMFDCDGEGENGVRHAAYELAQRCCVRIAWSAGMHGGRFKGRQPESLSVEEWALIADALRAHRVAAYGRGS